MSKLYKPIFYYHVSTGNRGDKAIKYSIVSAIKQRINIPFCFLNLKYDELTEARITNQLNKDASCLIIAGSGLYTNYNLSSGWYFPCKSNLFDKIKVPIILVGIGANKNLKGNMLNSDLSSATKNSIKHINELSCISTVRDTYTYNLLQSIGVANHKLMLDPANFLNIKNRKPKKRIVALNLAQHAPILGRWDGGDKGQAYRHRNLGLFAEVSDYLFSQGIETKLIAHDPLEQSLAIDLHSMVPYVKVVNTDNIQEMLSEYSECMLTLSIKMHSSILSVASGTPFINLYYDRKSTEYIKLLNTLGCRGINIFTEDYEELKSKTLSNISDILNNVTLYTNQLNAIIKNKRPEFENLINKIIYYIKESNEN
jgi:polysaccharide pyruvyl transferase WcaK-like protein